MECLRHDVYAALERAAYVASLLVERSLSQAHSFLHASAASLHVGVDPAWQSGSPSAQRAWWDPTKGSAVVVWSPGDQDLCHAVALALASVRSRTSAAGSTSRAGQPPYTVIVLVPEANRAAPSTSTSTASASSSAAAGAPTGTTDGLASLISAWAKCKADLAKEEQDQQGTKAVPEGHGSTADWDRPRGRHPILSWASTLLGIESISLRLSSPDTAASLDEGTGTMSSSASPFSTNDSTYKRRRKSLGGWSAQDVVGYGRDMLKGLRIGEMEQTGIGAIIPVVADTKTKSGLQHAQSTIQAYCLSHDLLLRALIVIPSLMQCKDVEEVALKDEITTESLVGSQAKLTRLANTIDHSISQDGHETLQLLAALVPTLKHDGGRVISLMPAQAHLLNAQAGQNASASSGIADSIERMRFTTTYNAMHQIWSFTRSALEEEGIFTSFVHMASIDKRRTDAVPTSSNDGANTPGARAPKRLKKDSLSTSLKRRLQKVVVHVCNEAFPLLYGFSSFELSLPSKGKNDVKRHAGRKLPSNLEEAYAQRREDAYAAAATASKPYLKSSHVDVCPPLLLDAVRSALVRSWPRKSYAVGLGPRLELAWQYLPGHEFISRCFVSLLL